MKFKVELKWAFVMAGPSVGGVLEQVELLKAVLADHGGRMAEFSIERLPEDFFERKNRKRRKEGGA